MPLRIGALEDDAPSRDGSNSDDDNGTNHGQLHPPFRPGATLGLALNLVVVHTEAEDQSISALRLTSRWRHRHRMSQHHRNARRSLCACHPSMRELVLPRHPRRKQARKGPSATRWQRPERSVPRDPLVHISGRATKAVRVGKRKTVAHELIH